MSSNAERQLAGSFVVDSLTAMIGDRIENVGKRMLEGYLAYGRGERADIRSTLVDMVADTGHFVVFEGGDEEAAFTAGNASTAKQVTHSPDTETQAAVAIAAIKSYAVKKGFDFDAILWLAKDHLRAETQSSSAKP